MYSTTHLNVSLVAGHREVPLPVAGAEGVAVPGPLLPRRHVLLADAAVLHPDHPAAEPDAAEHAEAARVRVQVAITWRWSGNTSVTASGHGKSEYWYSGRGVCSAVQSGTRAHTPPRTVSASKTTGRQPRSRRCLHAARPLTPAPTMATRFLSMTTQLWLDLWGIGSARDDILWRWASSLI